MLGLVRRRERRGRREDRAKRGSADRQGAAAPRALWGRLALRGTEPPHGAASRSRAVPSPTSAHFCSAPRSCQSGWICREGKPVCSPQTTKPFSSCAVCSCLITPCHFGTGPLLLSRSLGEDFCFAEGKFAVAVRTTENSALRCQGWRRSRRKAPVGPNSLSQGREWLIHLYGAPRLWAGLCHSTCAS